MAKHKRSIQALAVIGVLFLLTACSGDSLGLKPDGENSSKPGFGGSLGATLNDSFSYDAENPTLNLPVQVYAEKAGYHGDAADGTDVTVGYTVSPTSLAAGETLVIDLYGRSGEDCCAQRDDDFDIEFYSGGIGGTLVEKQTNLSIPNTDPYHLRVTYTDPTTIDSFLIVARDSDTEPPEGSYFTLMEIRAAVIGADGKSLD